MSTYREADMCESRNFKEKLFISTVHKAKGLEFENVVVLRAVNNRYPSFAHRKEDEQDEDKRLFYVAISRAMKRLIISGYEGSQNSFTPFIDKIMKPFCLRSELYASDKTRILVEITYDTIRIKTTIDGITHMTQFHPINRLFDYGTYRNQIDLLEAIKSRCCNIHAEDSLKNFLYTYSIC
jgi:DNA helicase-2/ATP-dependent DNA helicase PcrA